MCIRDRFRLCGGRVENIGELQQLAVRAGINGVMMGNFLTTLGSEPEDDRAMFEQLGLNVARQDDNGANPRPDNRSGWLEGESPRTPIDELIDHQAEANFWNPEEQLRRVPKGKVPARPDGAPNVGGSKDSASLPNPSTDCCGRSRCTESSPRRRPPPGPPLPPRRRPARP